MPATAGTAGTFGLTIGSLIVPWLLPARPAQLGERDRVATSAGKLYDGAGRAASQRVICKPIKQ